MTKKKKPSEMPPDIDLEEWERRVEAKRDRIAYDERFLALMEWFILGSEVAEVIDEQFSNCMDEQERKLITDLMYNLSTAGYAMQDPQSYYSGSEEDFVDDIDTRSALQSDLLRAMNRLAYKCMMSKMDMESGGKDFYGGAFY